MTAEQTDAQERTELIARKDAIVSSIQELNAQRRKLKGYDPRSGELKDTTRKLVTELQKIDQQLAKLKTEQRAQAKTLNNQYVSERAKRRALIGRLIDLEESLMRDAKSPHTAPAVQTVSKRVAQQIRDIMKEPQQ